MAPPTQTETQTVHSHDNAALSHEFNRHEVSRPGYAFAHLLPSSDRSLKLEKLVPFRHDEPGLRVKDPLTNPLNGLLGNANVKEITPLAGSDVSGIQLSALTPAQRDELSVFVARRKVVVFRDQDFGHQSHEFFKEWTSYYGRPHIHPTSAHPKGLDIAHLVYKDGETKSYANARQSVTSVAWHSDVSYELQPPGLTLFGILSLPGESGGDTVYADTVEAYNRLSDGFKKIIDGLTVIHSGSEQADFARSDSQGYVRREPVQHEHPLVRKHPVTGEKALYVNPGFSRAIVGFKKEESDAILKFLYDHIARGIDFHIRARYQPGTIVLWDNRVTSHTAIDDFTRDKQANEGFRHAFRLTPQAERPFGA